MVVQGVEDPEEILAHEQFLQPDIALVGDVPDVNIDNFRLHTPQEEVVLGMEMVPEQLWIIDTTSWN